MLRESAFEKSTGFAGLLFFDTLLPIETIMRKFCSAVAMFSVAAFGAPANADTFLLHLEGKLGDRRAYFANMRASDRTPPAVEPPKIATKELVVTIVYESAEMPELAELHLQFECQNDFYYAFHEKKMPKSPNANSARVRVTGDSVILRRADLKAEPVPGGDWEESPELAMLKAQQLACNDQKIGKVIRSSTVNGQFNRAEFEAKLPALGLERLTNGIVVTPLSLWTEYIDLAWTTFWPDGKRPDPNGKWSRNSTLAELAEAERQVALAKQQVDDLADRTKRAYEPKVLEMNDRFAFDAAAAKLRGGRKLRDLEAKMLQVWQARPEDDVIGRMGRPHFVDTGTLHLLTYSQEFDSRVTVGSSTGEVWEEGLYTNCDVQFVTMADDEGTHRVADIVLSIDSSNIMATNSRDACGALLNVPRR